MFDLPDNMEEIERIMMAEDFNITEDNLTILNNSNSNNYIREDNENSINKRQLSSSPIIISNKSKQMRKDNNKQLENNHELYTTKYSIIPNHGL